MCRSESYHSLGEKLLGRRNSQCLVLSVEFTERGVAVMFKEDQGGDQLVSGSEGGGRKPEMGSDR